MKYDKGHPLEDYYSNLSQQNPKNQQIKRIKSTENIPIMKADKSHKQDPKKPFIEPGNPCNSFEEIISTTCVNEEGLKTFYVSKALSGPSLQYASQQAKKKQPAKKPPKKLPEITQGINGNLEPHLQGYATITHEGTYRKSNEDKITILLEDDAKWFSIYDGHGGSKCSQFLKEHLHQYFFSFEWRTDVPTALRNAFLKAEVEWKKKGDNSGSCAIVLFIHNNVCYAANLGDSRAVLGSENITKCYQMTKDHKPSNLDEQKRIIEAGGKIYQTTAITQTNEGIYDSITGPLRILPGRLSMTRTFGDFEAKNTKMRSNNAEIIVCEPQITSLEIDQHDLIVMGSDGMWDKIANNQSIEIMKTLYQEGLRQESWYLKGSEVLLKQAMLRGSSDNISIIVIGLNNPQIPKQTKKGNQHIKIMGSMGMNSMRKKVSNKQNSYPEKIKQIDNKISQINKNASLMLQKSRRV